MKVVLLSPNAKVPKRADDFAAGYDLYTPKDTIIYPGRNVVPLDIQIELLPGTEAHIRPRSGFSSKGMEGGEVLSEEIRRYDADVLDGTIDENFRGCVGVIVKSYEIAPFIIKQGVKIAQFVIGYYVSEPFEVADKLTETERGEKGFGHTGTY